MKRSNYISHAKRAGAARCTADWQTAWLLSGQPENAGMERRGVRDDLRHWRDPAGVHPRSSGRWELRIGKASARRAAWRSRQAVPQRRWIAAQARKALPPRPATARVQLPPASLSRRAALCPGYSAEPSSRLYSLSHTASHLSKRGKASDRGAYCGFFWIHDTRSLTNHHFHPAPLRAHFDTTTGAPASGTARLHDPQTEPPCRRPALRYSFSSLVAV